MELDTTATAKKGILLLYPCIYLYKWQYGNIILIDIKCFIKNASLMVDKVNGDQQCEF
jgi:hypothetical protein